MVFRRLFAHFRRDRGGNTAVEYGLFAAIMGLAVVLGSGGMGNSMKNLFNSISDTTRNQMAP